MLAKLKTFFEKETVLCISALCAALTMLLVPVDGAYIGYIDFRVLCLLWCLMAVVALVQECGTFRFLAVWLVRRFGGGRVLGIILVLLPFFTAMLVTNDVALLTFVPFTLLLLESIDCRERTVEVLVLQTVAANLGSMATPVGNPQNLYLYGAYSLGAGEFFAAVLPLTAVSLVVLTVCAAFVLPKGLVVPALEAAPIRDKGKLAVYGVLFALCLLTVFHVLPYGVMTVIVLIAVAVMQPKLLKEQDYGLLATFVCFFIVSGNLGRVEAVRQVLQDLLGRSALLTSAAASQIISNVPAAVLLSAFTENWKELLQGVNIGGLGTPIASLASLITLKLYLRSEQPRAGRFLAVFTVVNVVGLAGLLAFALVF